MLKIDFKNSVNNVVWEKWNYNKLDGLWNEDSALFPKCFLLMSMAFGTSFINVFLYEVEFLWIHLFTFTKTKFLAFLPQFFLKKMQTDSQDVSDFALHVKIVVKVWISATPYLIYLRGRREKRQRGREKRQKVNECWVLKEAKTQ